MKENMREMLRSLALYPFRQRLSMSQTEFEVLIASAIRELDDLANKPYISLYENRNRPLEWPLTVCIVTSGECKSLPRSGGVRPSHLISSPKGESGRPRYP